MGVSGDVKERRNQNTKRIKKTKKIKKKRKYLAIQISLFLSLTMVLVSIVNLNMGLVSGYSSAGTALSADTQRSGGTVELSPEVYEMLYGPEDSYALEQDAEPEPTPEPEPAPTPLPEFHPYAVEGTEPENLIRATAVQVDGSTLASVENYTPAQEIEFLTGESYTDAEGLVTFRGDNFRSGAAYGTAEMAQFKFTDAWSINTGSTSYGGDTWTGSGWVGQPLIVRWPDSTKAVMNLYDSAKAKPDLVEVIYATMDGNVYFLDLETGENTRDPLRLGYTFKGAGALDPRGYPLMYLGSGFDSNLGKSHVFIISLIDCSVLYTFGAADSFSLRGGLSYFDSSALVDAETDTLIYPGENGILYLIHLNTQYEEAAGSLSIDPDRIVKWRNNGVRTGGAYWLGMEDSAVIWRGSLIVADNGGNLMCLDLNTLQLQWVQDTLDDTNCSPVLALEEGHPYVYISTSFHMGWRSSTTAPIPIWKIDAETGEIVWQTEYTCHTESGVSGGVQSTAALGRESLSPYVYVTVGKTDASNGGKLVCLDRASGTVVWEHDAYYTWSSPVAVYNSDGSGYICYCTMGGTLYMLDGLTGEELDRFDLGGGVEASPAVFNDRLVIGTRACKIWGIKLS